VSGTAATLPPERWFDSAAASAPVRRVPLDRLLDPLAVSHAPETVERYRVAMAAGDRFPPIAVVRWLGVFWVADGHKRLAAARALARDPGASIPVEVWGLPRWTADQLRQVRGELAKARRIPALLLRHPRQGVELLFASPRHWLRVARSLSRHARTALAGRRRSA
jgi:hypothetical protein